MINIIFAADTGLSIMSTSHIIVYWLNVLDRSDFFIISLMYSNTYYLPLEKIRNDGLELFRQSQTCKRDLCQHLTSYIPHVSKSKLFETVWNINLCLSTYVFGTEIRKKRSVTYGVWQHVFGTNIRKKLTMIPLHNMST